MVLKLSFSQISTYLECPYRYYLSYIVKLPGVAKPYFSFGHSVHSALERFHKPRLLPESYTLNDLLGWFDSSWKSEGFKDSQAEAKAKDEGKSLLVGYYERNKDKPQLSLEVEKKFTLEINSIKVSGVIDRIDRLPNGNLHLIDYKTGNFIPQELEQKDKLQLSIYTLAATKLFDGEVEKATYMFLRSGTELTFEPDSEQLATTIYTIEKVSSDINSGFFPKCKNKFCPWCDFYSFCDTAKILNFTEGF